MSNLGLPRGYDAWRTMSEDDYYEIMERRHASRAERDDMPDEPEPDYDFGEIGE